MNHYHFAMQSLSILIVKVLHYKQLENFRCAPNDNIFKSRLKPFYFHVPETMRETSISLQIVLFSN